jgi:hypothetical protein
MNRHQLNYHFQVKFLNYLFGMIQELPLLVLQVVVQVVVQVAQVV